MQVTVFGASGKVGNLVVEELLRRGHTVVAFVHSHNLFSPSGNLIVVQGDVYKKDDVAKAMQGSDAVISCLGSWGTPKRNVVSSAMEHIIPVMVTNGIHRIITLTGSGAQRPGEKDTFAHRMVMTLAGPFPAGKVFEDGEKHMRLLAASNLDWTTLRSPVMTNGGKQGYFLNQKVGGPLESVSRNAVAQALIDQLDTDEYLRTAPVLHRK
jgi:putative NADH-flavin reductase